MRRSAGTASSATEATRQGAHRVPTRSEQDPGLGTAVPLPAAGDSVENVACLPPGSRGAVPVEFPSPGLDRLLRPLGRCAPACAGPGTSRRSGEAPECMPNTKNPLETIDRMCRALRFSIE